MDTLPELQRRLFVELTLEADRAGADAIRIVNFNIVRHVLKNCAAAAGESANFTG
jgi:hypothetical protein